MAKNAKVEIFPSLESENQAEYRRRAWMTPLERWQEMAILQERLWGERWTSTPIKKVATWEYVDW